MFPVVVCLCKLSFSLLTLSSMVVLSFEIVSQVLLFSLLLNCCGQPHLLMSGVKVFLSVFWSQIASLFSFDLFERLNLNGRWQSCIWVTHSLLFCLPCNPIWGLSMASFKNNAYTCARVHTSKHTWPPSSGTVWITMFSMLSAAWHH